MYFIICLICSLCGVSGFLIDAQTLLHSDAVRFSSNVTDDVSVGNHFQQFVGSGYLPVDLSVGQLQSLLSFRGGWESPYLIHRHKVVIFSVPKCACSTLASFAHLLSTDEWGRARENQEISKAWKQLSISDLRKLIADKYMFVTAARNPMTRFLSFYKEKVIYLQQKFVNETNCPNLGFDGVMKAIADGSYTCRFTSSDHFAPQVQMDPSLYKYFRIADVDANLLDWGNSILRDVNATHLSDKWGPQRNGTLFSYDANPMTRFQKQVLDQYLNCSNSNRWLKFGRHLKKYYATDFALFAALGFNYEFSATRMRPQNCTHFLS